MGQTLGRLRSVLTSICQERQRPAAASPRWRLWVAAKCSPARISYRKRTVPFKWRTNNHEKRALHRWRKKKLKRELRHRPERARSWTAATMRMAWRSLTNGHTKSLPVGMGTPRDAMGTILSWDNLQRVGLNVREWLVWPRKPHTAHCSVWKHICDRHFPGRYKEYSLETWWRHCSCRRKGQRRAVCPCTPGGATNRQSRHVMTSRGGPEWVNGIVPNQQAGMWERRQAGGWASHGSGTVH